MSDVETTQQVYLIQRVPDSLFVKNLACEKLGHISLEWSHDRIFDRALKLESRNIIQFVGFLRVQRLVFDYLVVKN